MNRYVPAIAALAFVVLAAPAAVYAQANPAEPLNKPSSADDSANDLNAQSLKQVQQEQEKMNKAVEEENARRMEEWRKKNEERYREWKKAHPNTP